MLELWKRARVQWLIGVLGWRLPKGCYYLFLAPWGISYSWDEINLCTVWLPRGWKFAVRP